MKRRNLLTVVKMMVGAFVTLATLGGSASANHLNSWAIAGAGCVPVGQTSHAHLVFNSAGDAVGGCGSARLFSPVHLPTIDSAYTLTITYRDTDGFGTGASITAALRRNSVATGSVVLLARVSIDTNSGPS